jgi:tryptophanyl-tRNA synthetase
MPDIDPWGDVETGDYRQKMEKFGIDPIEDVADRLPDNLLVRRGIVFGQRGLDAVLDRYESGDDFAMMTGIMPSGVFHLGHKSVVDQVLMDQEMGADVTISAANVEAYTTRDMPLDEARDLVIEEYLTNYVALGLDIGETDFYFQTDGGNDYHKRSKLFARYLTQNEVDATYGDTNPGKIVSALTQYADIFRPQFPENGGPVPTVVPIGIDQDPHLRLTRDLAARTRYFGVTEAYASFEATEAERSLLAEAHDALESDEPTCEEAADWLEAEADPGEARDGAVRKLRNAGEEPLERRVRFVDRNATEEAFEGLVEAVEGEKRVYEGHVDAFELDRDAAEALAREVEVDHGGYGFYLPSSIYHRFMTGLTGGKMSSSVPASHISLLDDPEDGYDKVKAATTGGRETAEKQRELGGKADECPVYELYAYLLANDDDDFAAEVYEECVTGERLCGGCKEQAAELMEAFLEDHQEKREEARELLEDADIELDSPRK